MGRKEEKEGRQKKVKERRRDEASKYQEGELVFEAPKLGAHHMLRGSVGLKYNLSARRKKNMEMCRVWNLGEKNILLKGLT